MLQLIDGFGLGLWNGWVLILPVLLVLVVGSTVLRRRDTYESKEEMSRHTKKEERVSRITSILMILMIVLCFVLPLRLGTIWFHTGVPVYLIGISVITLASLTLATTPADMPATSGVYSFSRHPMNIGNFFSLTGIGVSCASWIFLLCVIIFIALMSLWLPSEERWCLKRFGDSYKEYLERTPRWIGPPRSTY